MSLRFGMGRVGLRGHARSEGVGGVAPTITSIASQSVAENTPVAITLTADQVVTWSIVGGADAALFDIADQALEGSALNFEAPADAGGNNVYNFTVRATNAGGQYSDQAMTLTVTDAVENIISNLSWVNGGSPGQTITDGKLTWTAADPYGDFQHAMSPSAVAGKYYQLSYFFERTLGEVRPYLGGGVARVGTPRNAAGAPHVERLLINSGNNVLAFQSFGDPGPNTMAIPVSSVSLIGPYNTATIDGA